MTEVTKPKWLRRLEKESWQAELIVSGIAIFGALQLPGLLEKAIEYCLYYFSEQVHYGLFILFIYLYFAVYIIIVSLLVHFVVRTVWIGFIGLNSVFPKGINPESKTYPPHFMERLLADYPNASNYISDLDKFCSTIFAFSAFTVLTMVAIVTNVAFLLWLYSMFAGQVSSTVFKAFFTGYMVLISTMGILIYLLNIKQLREKSIYTSFSVSFI